MLSIVTDDEAESARDQLILKIRTAVMDVFDLEEGDEIDCDKIVDAIMDALAWIFDDITLNDRDPAVVDSLCNFAERVMQFRDDAKRSSGEPH